MTGKPKPFGLMLGLLGNVMIGLALNKLIQTGSCGGVGLAPCPSELTPYFIMLPVGILISVVAVFLGGSAIVFAGIFLAVGIGALAAGLGSEDDNTRTFGLIFGGIFAAVPVFMLVLSAGAMRLGASKTVKAQNLIATGAKGVGTISAVRDTGMTINDNPRVEVTMRIEPEDGSAAFDASKTVTVSRVAIPRAGDRFPVWYDRADPTTWAYGTDMDASAAPPDVQALFGRAAAGPPVAVPLPDDGPADELAKLHDLHLKGVLTAAEFETAKARILKT